MELDDPAEHTSAPQLCIINHSETFRLLSEYVFQQEVTFGYKKLVSLLLLIDLNWFIKTH